MLFSFYSRKISQSLVVFFDLILLSVCGALALRVRFPLYPVETYLEILQTLNFLVTAFFVVLFNYIFSLYESRHWLYRIFSPLRIALAVICTAAMTAIWIYLVASPTEYFTGRGVLLGTLGSYYMLSMVMRYQIQRLNLRQSLQQRWLVVCSKAHFERLQEEVERSKFDQRFDWIDLEEAIQDPGLVEKRTLRDGFRGVVFSGSGTDQLNQVLMRQRLRGLQVFTMQNFYEMVWEKIPLFSLSASWFAFSTGFYLLRSPLNLRLKRVTDILISATMLVVGAPVMALVYLAVRLESRGPGIYSQTRVGWNGHTFTIHKFRSRVKDAEKAGAQWAKASDARVTRVGWFIRKTRLDELPQLWDILRGDMSFIGPRPERPEFTCELAKQIPYYDLRHLVKPGLTGWAQVRYPYGASEKDAEEKLQYDLFYIKNFDYFLDLKIILKTVYIVVFGKGR